MYELLTRFEKLSGFPILLNTSFNVKDKTMILYPEDAYKTFLETDIDILVINDKMYF
jgi:carbamoyltransferase